MHFFLEHEKWMINKGTVVYVLVFCFRCGRRIVIKLRVGAEPVIGGRMWCSRAFVLCSLDIC